MHFSAQYTKMFKKIAVHETQKNEQTDTAPAIPRYHIASWDREVALSLLKERKRQTTPQTTEEKNQPTDSWHNSESLFCNTMIQEIAGM